MNKLDELLNVIQNDHVFIQMHNYPDQDALASAKGLQTLLAVKQIPSTIIYKGRIDKFNTLKMIELLHIEINTFDEVHITEKDEIILVDGQKGNINVEDSIGREIACVDHHKKTVKESDNYRFIDIRTNIGACSTIITSYFLENDIKINKEVATALVYGIKMDTDTLTRGISDADIDAFCHLYKLADLSILRIFDSCKLKTADLKAYQQAIADLRIIGSIALSNIGKDYSEAIIATMSDFLLTLNEVDFTLIYSYRAGGIKFSLRSEDADLDASHIIKVALIGFGDGGGHSSMAAGFIPNVPEEEADTIARTIEEKVVHLVTLEKSRNHKQ